MLGRHPCQLSEIPPPIEAFTADLRDAAGLLETIGQVVSLRGKLGQLIFAQRFRGSDDSWTGEFETSVNATKLVVDRLRQEFRPDQHPVIIIILSPASGLIADEQPLSYHAAKAALLQMMRYYAVQLGPSGIRVNCVSPGVVVRENNDSVSEQETDRRQFYSDLTPLRRMITSQDVANVVKLLCSADAACVTGQNIQVDGGLGLQLQASLANRVRGSLNIVD